MISHNGCCSAESAVKSTPPSEDWPLTGSAVDVRKTLLRGNVNKGLIAYLALQIVHVRTSCQCHYWHFQHIQHQTSEQLLSSGCESPQLTHIPEHGNLHCTYCTYFRDVYVYRYIYIHKNMCISNCIQFYFLFIFFYPNSNIVYSVCSTSICIMYHERATTCISSCDHVL